MAVMLNDLLKRTPLLTLVPFFVWMLGMTVYTIQWKTSTEYQLERVVSASENIQKHSERIIILEQGIKSLRDNMDDLKTILYSKEKIQ